MRIVYQVVQPILISLDWGSRLNWSWRQRPFLVLSWFESSWTFVTHLRFHFGRRKLTRLWLVIAYCGLGPLSIHSLILDIYHVLILMLNWLWELICTSWSTSINIMCNFIFFRCLKIWLNELIFNRLFVWFLVWLVILILRFRFHIVFL